ncbi:hypothetical protein [Desulfosporosinus sp. Sb-LF]|uniref:hypothetical protein n=1 Tax=Desulfosporosinus sp. Sb-LF TaxID=2560027 RepID=UPI00107F7556|nr:hypothetical protein [Desulfosporosinus sp. Sb-LF]TGE34139.1 hypothetical protein E4K68_00015 [Desulfosporosinus sp. Sb-LF]
MLERTIFKHLNVYGVGVPPVRVHIAGECVTSRNVAKVSPSPRSVPLGWFTLHWRLSWLTCTRRGSLQVQSTMGVLK